MAFACHISFQIFRLTVHLFMAIYFSQMMKDIYKVTDTRITEL